MPRKHGILKCGDDLTLQFKINREQFKSGSRHDFKIKVYEVA